MTARSVGYVGSGELQRELVGLRLRQNFVHSANSLAVCFLVCKVKQKFVTTRHAAEQPDTEPTQPIRRETGYMSNCAYKELGCLDDDFWKREVKKGPRDSIDRTMQPRVCVMIEPARCNEFFKQLFNVRRFIEVEIRKILPANMTSKIVII